MRFERKPCGRLEKSRAQLRCRVFNVVKKSLQTSGISGVQSVQNHICSEAHDSKHSTDGTAARLGRVNNSCASKQDPKRTATREAVKLQHVAVTMSYSRDCYACKYASLCWWPCRLWPCPVFVPIPPPQVLALFPGICIMNVFPSSCYSSFDHVLICIGRLFRFLYSSPSLHAL